MSEDIRTLRPKDTWSNEAKLGYYQAILDMINILKSSRAKQADAGRDVAGMTCCENGRFDDGHECMKQPAQPDDSYGFHIMQDHNGGFDSRCYAKNGEFHHATGSKVVLTVAHLNHEIEDCSDGNLKAMCQRCHNKMDAPMRRAGIKKRAREKSAIGELL